MNFIINLYVIISAIYLTTTHIVGLADKVIIATYILFEMYICFLWIPAMNRGVKAHFDITSFIQLGIPTFLIIMYFLNDFSLVFFNSSIRIF